MRNIVWAVFITVISAVSVDAAILVYSPDGSYKQKPDLAAAATAADAAGKTVVVTSALSAVMSNISSSSLHAWPADRKLKVAKGGSIGNTTKFAVNAPFESDLHNAFTGGGRVIFGAGSVSEVYPEWFGARGDGVADDAPALTKAVAAAGAQAAVMLGRGTYLVGSVQHSNGNYLENVYIPLRNGTSLIGVPGKSILKLKDGMLTGADTLQGHLLGGERLSNITVKNITFDMNGAKNLTPSGKIRNAMAIRIGSGGSNVSITGSRFLNCAGHNVIALNCTSSGGVWKSGKGARIAGNRFINGGHYVGTPTENVHNRDFSFIYSEWTETTVSGNHIEQQDIDIALHHYTGGCELHGSSSRFTKNTVIGCDPAVYVASAPAAIADITVSDNSMKDCLRGVVFWMWYPMKNVTIAGNTIELNRSKLRSTDYAIGIQQPNGGSAVFDGAHANATFVEDLVIEKNSIKNNVSGKYDTFGIGIHSIYKGKISNNSITGMNNFGITISGSPWGLRSVEISRNTIADNGRYAYGDRGAGIFIDIKGSSKTPPSNYWISDVSITENVFENTESYTYDSGRNVTNVSSTGKQSAAVIWPNLSSSVVTNFRFEKNTLRNLIYDIYGPATNQLELYNASARNVTGTHISTAKPLDNVKVFQGEEIHYLSDNTKYRVSKTGTFSTKTGTVTTSAGSRVVTVDNAFGLHVGTMLVIPGTGVSGTTFSGNISEITDLNHIVFETAPSTSVVKQKYAVNPPGLIPL
jgi:hypothetical protein